MEEYAAMMKAGQWLRDTGETIKISADGKLLDGQHRLHAVIKAGIPIEMQVADACSDQIQNVIDQGRPRSAADVLNFNGYTSTSQLSAVVTTIIKLERGTIRARGRVNSTDVLEYAQQLDLEASMQFSASVSSRGKFLTRTEWTVLHFALHGIDSEAAGVFLKKLSKGLGLAENEPVTRLRQKLEQAKMGRYYLSPEERLALCFKAWNMTRKGETATVIKYNSNLEEFPTPV
ncbi:hypothetical protein BWI93_05285 [Siphonobacter sp. BAB-5385]|uniref:hypothetical protein n=1 Tax=Siphonobacter sp. BAB-5385 TaxID=1864822 RepID=UPI000B9E5918|nr:hypothetical protein [Siphonobacter sp. BAB-5385]OZI09160.1 hypothetical protein BWI93_05285 [Siphonobacter sp. BAB-5385]